MADRRGVRSTSRDRVGGARVNDASFAFAEQERARIKQMKELLLRPASSPLAGYAASGLSIQDSSPIPQSSLRNRETVESVQDEYNALSNVQAALSTARIFEGRQAGPVELTPQEVIRCVVYPTDMCFRV